MIRVKSARLPFWGEKENLEDLHGEVLLSSAASSRTIYQLNCDEMSSEAASTRSPHNLEVVVGLWPIFHSGLSSSISFLLPTRFVASKINQYPLLSSDKILPFLRLKRLANTGQLCGSSPGSPLVWEAKLLIDYSDSAKQRALQSK